MSDPESRGSLWVRYLGGRTTFCAQVFAIPTATVPDRVRKLRSRNDVAQIWYIAGTEWDWKLAHEEYNYEAR
jgi:hypothetical protein